MYVVFFHVANLMNSNIHLYYYRLASEGESYSYPYDLFDDAIHCSTFGRLLLGGGFGHLTPALGLAIDNLVQVCSSVKSSLLYSQRQTFQATIVTASGSILTASATKNSDLFWGIRGGGCNFGVGTEFVLKLHPQRATVFAGLIMFAPTAVDKVCSALCQWWKKGPSVKESIIAHFGRGTGGTVRRQVISLAPFRYQSLSLALRRYNRLLQRNCGRGKSYLQVFFRRRSVLNVLFIQNRFSW